MFMTSMFSEFSLYIYLDQFCSSACRYNPASLVILYTEYIMCTSSNISMHCMDGNEVKTARR